MENRDRKGVWCSVISWLLIIVMMLTLVPINITISHAKAGTELAIGNYIYFGYYDIDKSGTKDADERILWRVIHRDGNNVLLLTDKIIMLKAFDGKDGSQVNADRKLYGSNNWADSNLRLWLNSTSQSMDDNSYGGSNEAPNNANVWNNYNEYSTEDGFLSDTNFTVDERSAIVPVNNKYVIDTAVDTAEGNAGTEHSDSSVQPDIAVTNYNTSAYQTVQGQLGEYDKVFVLSIKELADYVDGNTTLDINGNYHIATTTSDARTYSEYDMSTHTGAWYYWTRDAHTANSCNVRFVTTGGNVNNCNAFDGDNGVRPALWLDTSSMTLADVSGATEAEAYTVTSFAPLDTTKPVIINTKSEENILKDSVYGVAQAKVGVTATDDTDGDITGDIVIGGDAVDTSLLGDYTITYNVADSAGNAANEVTRTIHVLAELPAYEGYEVGTAPSDRKWFKYYIGRDKNNITKVMLVCADNAGSLQTTFDSEDILDTTTHKFKNCYYIDRDGKIKKYSAD